MGDPHQYPPSQPQSQSQFFHYSQSIAHKPVAQSSQPYRPYEPHQLEDGGTHRRLPQSTVLQDQKRHGPGNQVDYPRGGNHSVLRLSLSSPATPFHRPQSHDTPNMHRSLAFQKDAESRCGSCSESGPCCTESDCEQREEAVPCSGSSCEQPPCTDQSCLQGLESQHICADDTSRLTSWNDDTWTGQQLRNQMPNYDTAIIGPHHASGSPSAASTPSLATNLPTPPHDHLMMMSPRLFGSTYSNGNFGPSMVLNAGTQFNQCRWNNCGTQIDSMQAWSDHIHQAHLDPQMQYQNCLMPDGCQPSVSSHPAEHLIAEHNYNFTTVSNGFPCPAPDCMPSEMFCDPQMLHIHMDQVHATPVQGIIQCQWDACGNKMNNPSEFFNHLDREHNIPITGHSLAYLPGDISLCTPQMSGEISTAADHARLEAKRADTTVLDDDHLTCQWQMDKNRVCGQYCSSEEALQSHVKDDHLQSLSGETGYICQWLGCKRGEKKELAKGFTQRGKLERHMATHTNFKMCKCDWAGCGKAFSAPQALEQHKRLHTGEKPWKCQYCEKRFPQQSAKTIHERTHTKHKPLMCDVCGKGFAESSNLAKHRKIHNKKLQFACNFDGCTKSFVRLDQLKRHKQIHAADSESLSSASTVLGAVLER